MFANNAKCSHCGATVPPDVGSSDLCPSCLVAVAIHGGSGIDHQDEAPHDHTHPTVDERCVPLARLLPQFESITFLGRGGMGEVYQARQPQLEREVAIKVMPQAVCDNPLLIQRFRREVKALAALHHPGIVAIHDSGEVNGRSYFVMEYVAGVTLREKMREGRLPARTALWIARLVCAAVEHAHQRDVIHRDIKPENIIVRDGILDDEVELSDSSSRTEYPIKVADFGLARLFDSPSDLRLTGAEDGLGTPYYMAPEQHRGGGAVGHRADIFALGVLLYEMLTGILPQGRLRPPSELCPVDKHVDAIVLKCLEAEPENRFASATDLLAALDALPTQQPQRDGRLPRAVKRWPLVVAAIALLSLLTGALAMSNLPMHVPDAVLRADSLIADPGRFDFRVEDLLRNDSLPMWDDYEVRLASRPKYGRIEMTKTGLSYFAAGFFVGTDRFSYHLVNGETTCESGSVLLFVNSRNHYAIPADTTLDVTIASLHRDRQHQGFLIAPGNSQPPLNPSRPEFQDPTKGPPGAIWAYWDRRESPGPEWTKPEHDDSSWQRGAGEFGSSAKPDDPPARTRIAAGDEVATTYFRTHFTVAEPTAVRQLWGHLLRDDGAAVYLNGVEVQRQRLRSAATHTTWSQGKTDEDNFEESYYFSFPINSDLLKRDNVLAVEVHQHGVRSKDASFDLALTTSPLGFLADDYAQSFSAQLVADTEHGSLSLGDDGTFAYTPRAGFIGRDRFTCRLESSGGEVAEQTVVIDVHGACELNVELVESDDRSAGGSDPEVNTASPFLFRFTRAGDSSHDLIARYQVGDDIPGVARNGRDYRCTTAELTHSLLNPMRRPSESYALSGSLRIPAGLTSVDLAVFPTQSTNWNGETITLRLLASPLYQIGSSASATAILGPSTQ